MTTTQRSKRPQTARQLANQYRRLLDKLSDDQTDQDDYQVFDYLYQQLSLDAKGLETVRSRVAYGLEHWEDMSDRERELLQAFFSETAPVFSLTQEDTVGCYAHDADGIPWSTWEIAGALLGEAVPDEHRQQCAACGKKIASGWSRGKLFEQTFYCSSHIVYVTNE